MSLNIETVSDSISFENYLLSLPSIVQRRVAIAIVARCTIRLVPFLAEARHIMSAEKFAEFLLRELRLICIAKRDAIHKTLTELIILSSNIDAGTPKTRDGFYLSSLLATASQLNENAAKLGNIKSTEELSQLASKYVESMANRYAIEIATADSNFKNEAPRKAQLWAVAAEQRHDSATQEVWDNVRRDIEQVIRFGSIRSVYDLPLWHVTNAFIAKQFAEFRSTMVSITDVTPEVSGTPWLVWWRWFEPQTRGSAPWGLSKIESEEYELQIALGNNKDGLKKRNPHAVTIELFNLIAEAQYNQIQERPQVFISYNKHNLETAQLVGQIIDEETGYRCFAQFKNMPHGANFVTEMQKGLEGMDLFAPLYSPQYVKSEICEAEWNAAFLTDPKGEKRKIRAFLLDANTVLKPFHKSIVYVPLYNLAEAKLREAIRDSFEPAGYQRTPEQSRLDAQNIASPLPLFNNQEQLDIHVPEEEAPFITDDLANLPRSLRRQLENLIGSFVSSPANCPNLLKTNLENYLEEININGARPFVADLNRIIALIANVHAEAASDGAGWLDLGRGIALTQLYETHEAFIRHFPLRMLDDLKIEMAPIKSNAIENPILIAASRDAVSAAIELQKDNLSTLRPSRLLALREQSRKDIESVPDQLLQTKEAVIPQPGTMSKQELQKRWLFTTSGFYDNLLSRTEKIVKIADTDAGKALRKAAKMIVDNIWS